jgi:phosphohistidine phosphatase SixA
MHRRTGIIAGLVIALAAPAVARLQRDGAAAPIYVVRHAERADAAPPGQRMMSGADPALSQIGEARAKRLAAVLRDAGVTRIFTTEYRRTRQTAEPIAAAASVEIAVVPARDLAGLLQKLAEAAGPALVVGHSNTVPDILKSLGVSEPIRIADDEYDRLFVVVRRGGEPELLKLRY